MNLKLMLAEFANHHAVHEGVMRKFFSSIELAIKQHSELLEENRKLILRNKDLEERMSKLEDIVAQDQF